MNRSLLRPFARGFALLGCCLLASCAPTNTGTYSADDLAAFTEQYQAVCARTFTPGHVSLLTRGRVSLTGRYRLAFNPSTGQEEIGQIDVSLDFADAEESAERFYRIVLQDIEISNVTGLAASGAVGVGWTTSLEITGDVGITEPVGTEPIPALIQFEATGSKTSVGAEGDGSSTRLVDQRFEGQFVQEVEFGLFPLSVCGTVTDRSGRGVSGEFFLRQR